jgi:hypothetical protein
MSDEKARQHSDSKQGGEGTNSFHNKSYDPMTKSIGQPPGNTTGGEKKIDEGTK